MQWNNEIGYQQPQQDVYADVRTPYSANPFAQDNTDSQEFSLSSIQQKLGAISSTVEVDTGNSSPDVMPSTQTLNMSYQREYQASGTRAATKLSTKGKIMIASYAIVVLALIVAVTLCGVSVTSTFDAALVSSVDYSELAAEVDALTVLSQTENFDELDRRATELGYIDASQSTTMTYTELETRPAQNFSIETNWFDSLCDWFSNVFGG